MLAFYTYLHWTDEDGTEHQLPGWNSGLKTLVATAYVDDAGRHGYCNARFAGGTCECPEPHEWRSIARPGALLSHSVAGIQAIYTMPVAEVIAIYENASEHRLRELTLLGDPVYAAARIAELCALPAGTVITASEWDQG